jgi:nucleotide-binding universal stress UspA family protein
MYNSILVPLDGSDRAEAILPHVEALARSFSAEVVFLIVVEPSTPMTTPHGSLLDLELVEQTTEQAEAYLAGLQGEYQGKGIAGRRFVEYGPVVETISRVAEREQVDLIAMASHGRGGLARVFYGSVTAGLLQRVDRPLLLIRSQNE